MRRLFIAAAVSTLLLPTVAHAASRFEKAMVRDTLTTQQAGTVVKLRILERQYLRCVPGQRPEVVAVRQQGGPLLSPSPVIFEHQPGVVQKIEWRPGSFGMVTLTPGERFYYPKPHIAAIMNITRKVAFVRWRCA